MSDPEIASEEPDQQDGELSDDVTVDRKLGEPGLLPPNGMGPDELPPSKPA